MERNSAEENKTLRGELTAEQCAKFTVLESHYKRLERVLGKIPQEELGKLLPKRMGYQRSRIYELQSPLNDRWSILYRSILHENCAAVHEFLLRGENALNFGNETYQITDKHIAEFADELQQREYSRGTVDNYIRSMKAYTAWNGGELSKEHIIAWKKHLAAQHAPATVNAMLAGLNCFLRIQGWNTCCVRLLRLQRRIFLEPKQELTREEYQSLVKTARYLGRERLALVMETICATGIRVSEITYITVEAVKQGKSEISLKGKIRTILLPNKLRRRLLKYARKLHISTGPIFRTRTGRALSRTQIWTEMKHLCRYAGIAERKVFPHNLRHLFARVFYQAYKDVVKLADILGHSSINTTRVYLLTTSAEHIQKLDHLALLC